MKHFTWTLGIGGALAVMVLLSASPVLADRIVPSSEGFIAFTVNPLGAIVPGDPVFTLNPLAPEGLLHSPGGGFPTTESVAPFAFTNVVPLDLCATAGLTEGLCRVPRGPRDFGRDPAGRFGESQVTVREGGFGRINMSDFLRDKDVNDGKVSGAFSRGVVEWVNDFNISMGGTAGGRFGLKGTVPAAGFIEMALTGSFTVNSVTTSFNPIVFACAGPSFSTPNRMVAIADHVVSVACSGNEFFFDGFSLAGGNFVIAPGERLRAAMNVSVVADPGGTIETIDLPDDGLGPTFGARSEAAAKGIPEPSTWLLLATGLVGLFVYRWRRQRVASRLRLSSVAAPPMTALQN